MGGELKLVTVLHNHRHSVLNHYQNNNNNNNNDNNDNNTTTSRIDISEAVSNVAEGVSNVQITEDSTSPSASDDATPMSDAAESDVTSTSTSSSAPTSNETSGSTGGDAAQDQDDQDAEDDGEDYGDDDEDYGDEDDGEDEGADKGPKPVVEDSREHLNVVFIGHVDAGKSTISGNLLYLQGVVDERTIQKYEREAKEKNRDSWYYAYIMDTNEEERAKGKTVEVGRAHFETPVKRYTILDAPGHKNYVPNMIGGAAQADIGILVISARKGEFETGFDRGGQTREHATLAKTLGVRQIVVAINKMDESTVLWSKERYDEIVDKLTPFLKSIGYNPKSDITFLPVSGITGANLKVRTDLSVCPWYNGPALVDLLDGLKPLDRNETGPLRIPVLDRYKDRGIAFVMGKIESGTIHKGQPVVVMPMKKRSEVLMVELETGEVPRARPGENVNIGLSNVTLADIQQGFVVCDVDNQIPCVTEFEAQLAIIDLLPHKSIVSAGYSAILHVHTAAVEVSITDLLSALDKKTRQPSKRKPAFGKKGDVITALIRTEATLCLELFSTLQQLGRFTLRDEGKTIAIGKVTALR